MLKRFACSAALFLLSLTPTLTIAQSSDAASSYDQPRAVKLDAVIRKTFPAYYGREEWSRLYTEGFYPIGWSRDGKFAYYLEPVDEACGCYYAELVIQDLRTDEILWKFTNDPEARTDAEGAPLEDDIRRLWARNRELFSEKLREHNIVQSGSFALLGRAFRSGGRSYTTKMIVRKVEDEGFGLMRVRTATLEISTPSLGKKAIFAGDNSGNIIAAPLNIAVAGALKSPYENRAAVIMINLQRGWEGPPNTVYIKIAGADLDAGFKR
jgi:hypothetical protein